MTTTAAPTRLTVADVAAQIRRNPQTVRRYFRTGLLRGDKVNGAQYLTTQEWVDDFLRGDTTAPAAEPKPMRNPRKYPSNK